MAKIGMGAFVHPKAQLDDTVIVEPYAHIEENVVIGAHTKVGRFVTIHKNTHIGAHNCIHAFSCLATPPQTSDYDPSFQGKLILGDHNIIHQYVTISHGAQHSIDGLTRLGNNNIIMANSHIGHDAKLEDHVILVNHATLAGHVEIASHAIIGAFCAVHQFCKVGESSMLTAAAMVNKDVLPFIMVARNPSKIFGINKVGLQRRDFSKEVIHNIQQAYRLIFRSVSLKEKILEELSLLAATCDKVNLMKRYIETSQRGILR